MLAFVDEVVAEAEATVRLAEEAIAATEKIEDQLIDADLVLEGEHGLEAVEKLDRGEISFEDMDSDMLQRVQDIADAEASEKKRVFDEKISGIAKDSLVAALGGVALVIVDGTVLDFKVGIEDLEMIEINGLDPPCCSAFCWEPVHLWKLTDKERCPRIFVSWSVLHPR